MDQVFEFSPNTAPFRVRYDSPVGASVGTCLLIQSGQLGSYDEPTGEVLLYERLVESLTQKQVGVLRLDMKRRTDLSRPADNVHLSARTERVHELITEPSLTSYLSHYVLCGFSLGAQTILQLITAQPREGTTYPCGCVLVGCVIESPRVVMSNLQTIQLVYGARDYIAYVDDDSTEYVAIPPHVYGQNSVEMLIVRPRQRCEMNILDGLSHLLLTGCDEEKDNLAVRWLTDKIREMLTDEEEERLN